MSIRSVLKAYFNTGDKPTEAEFADFIDSDYNLDDDTSDDLTEGSTKLLLTTTERSNISSNTTHRTSDGKNHSDVVLNNTHRTSNGSDHSFIDQDVTNGSDPTFGDIAADGLTYNAVEANLSTLTPSSSIAANFLNNSFLQVTLTINTTITVTNLKVGVNTLWITQPAAFKTVGKTGWGTLVDNSDDVAEVNDAISIVQFIYNGTTILYTVLTSGA